MNDIMRPNQIHTSLPNQLGSEKMAMELIEPFLDSAGLSKERMEDLKTLVSEACLNAIEHGNQMVPSKEFEFELSFEEKQTQVGGILFIRVWDEGGKQRWDGRIPSFRDIHSYMDSEDNPRGWGLQLIDLLADEWRFEIGERQTLLEIQVRIEG